MNEDKAEKPQILIVDDSKVVRRAATKMLGDDYHVHEAVNGLDGWQQLQRNDAISVVFTDMQMPEMNGIELLANIRNSADERLSSLPVIMITGVEDTEATKRQVFDAGATDFVAKPFQSLDLLSRARSYAGLNRRVAELEKNAGHDELTGLLSTPGFEEHAEKAFSFAVRHQLGLSTVVLEIRHFDDIYLDHGKSAAQQIIATVAQRLQEVMRTEDVAARIGAARYALLLPLTNKAAAHVVISRLLAMLDRLVFSVRGDKIHIDLAAGCSALGCSTPRDFTEMLRQAETALQEALDGTAGDNIVFCQGAEQPALPDATDEVLRAAVLHVLEGDYSQIPDEMLQAVADRLSPFLDYVANRPDTGMTGTENS